MAARACYRSGLNQQFLWNALQAIEKYLKAILLYNKKKTGDLGHSVYKAYERVLTIEKIPFDFTNEVTEFIEYIDKQGQSRYFEFPYYLKGDDLYSLDRTVWHIRRYCYYMGSGITPNEIRKVQNKELFIKPQKYRIPGGWLEKVLYQRNHPARDLLVWKNPCYGILRKKKIRVYPTRFAGGNPTHVLYPEIIDELSAYVCFSKKFKRALKN